MFWRRSRLGCFWKLRLNSRSWWAQTLRRSTRHSSQFANTSGVGTPKSAATADFMAFERSAKKRTEAPKVRNSFIVQNGGKTGSPYFAR
jgi:hypothetical protein